MSVYMTEEEQLEAIKQWWKKYSNLITIGLSVILLLIAGSRYWTWHQNKVIAQASVAYENMMIAYANKNNESSQAYANQLMNEFGKTSYADAARMLVAKQLAEGNQFVKARTYLEQVADKGRMPAFQQIARSRLARLFIVDKQYKKALQELEKVNDTVYLPMVNELKGDIYAAMGEPAKALTYYTDAMNEAKHQNIGNVFLEMKTNELAAMNEQSVAKNKTIQTV